MGRRISASRVPAQRVSIMKQEFVYHVLTPRKARARPVRAHAADATVAVKEYLAYVAMLSIAVVIAIITFTYAANITVKWLDAAVKPSFLAEAQTVATPSTQLAMLPAAKPFKTTNRESPRQIRYLFSLD